MTPVGQFYCTTVYVRLKDKPKYEVHTYSHTVKEDNAVIIATVKKDLIAAGYDVLTVLLGETICKNCVDTELELA